MTTMTIGGLAEAAGVGVETVRYYQRRGLLRTPERAGSFGPGSGVRRYGEADVARLRSIRAAQAAGFSLEEAGRLLDLDTADREDAQALALARIAALDAKIAELQAARLSLANLYADCAAGRDGPCPIVTAFAEAP